MTSTTNTASRTTPKPTSIVATGRRAERVPLRTVGRGAAASVGLALLATTAILAVGDAGAPVRVPTGSGAEVARLAIGAVAAASVTWLLVGAVGLALLDRLRGDGFGPWAVLASLLAVASVFPVAAFDVDAGSRLAVAALHLVVGAAAVVGHGWARRRTP